MKHKFKIETRISGSDLVCVVCGAIKTQANLCAECGDRSKNKKLHSDSIEVGNGYWFCGICHTEHAKQYDANKCCR